MTSWRRAILAFCIVAMALLAGGCWNRREVETLGFVIAVGVDRSPEGRVELTAQIAIPSLLGGGGGVLGGGGGGGGGGVPPRRAFWTITSAGDTVFDAVRNFLSQSTRRINWSHNEVIVFSEAYARNGVRDALDFFDRDGEPRRTAWVMVARDTPIQAILTADFPTERLGGVAIDELISVSRSGLGKAHHADLNHFLRSLSAPGMEPFATGLMLAATERGTPGEEKQGVLKQHLRALGNAVFRGDRMVGWIDERESRGMVFMHETLTSTILVVPCPGEEERKVSIEVLHTSSSITPEVKNGRIAMKIELSLEGNVGDVGCSKRPDQQWVRSVERRVAAEVRKEVELVLKRTQKELKVDMIGFGLALYRHEPRMWEQVKDRWDELFPDVPVTVDVQANVRRTGLTRRPIPVR